MSDPNGSHASAPRGVQGNQEIERLHAAYCEGSGLQLALTVPRMFAWQSWLEHGAQANPPWGVEQLINTLAFLHREIKKYERKPACLRFIYIVENPENFEEQLALARKDWLIAQRLNRKPKFGPEKASVLRATGRPDAPADPAAKPASELIPNWKGLAQGMRQAVNGGEPNETQPSLE